MIFNRYMKVAFAAMFLFGSSVVALGQSSSSLNKQVEIFKQYSPTIGSAIKREFQPQPVEVIKMRAPEFDYSIAYTPQFYRPTFNLLETIDISKFNVQNVNQGYANFAVGVPLSTRANAYYTTRPTENWFAGAFVNHNGFWGDITNMAGVKSDASDSQTSVGGMANYRKDNFIFDTKLSYAHDSYTMYGYAPIYADDFSDFIVKKYNRVNFDAKISTPYTIDDSWDAHLAVDVDYADADQALGNYAIGANAGVAKGMADGKHNIIFNADFLYNGRIGSVVGGTTKQAAVTSTKQTYFTPSLGYRYIADRFTADVDLGLLISGYNESTHTKFLPNVVGRYKGEGFAVSVGVRSKYSYNLFSELSRINPYYNNYSGGLTPSVEYNAFAAVDVKITNWLSAVVNGGWSDDKDRAFFVNKSLGYSFDAMQADFKYAYGGIALKAFLMDKFNMSAEYTYKDIKCIGVPGHEFGLSAQYKFTPKLSGYAGVNIYSTRYECYTMEDIDVAYANYEIPTKANISLGASYKFNNWLGVTLDIDNLLNSKMYEYNFYAGHGIVVLAGVELFF